MCVATIGPTLRPLASMGRYLNGRSTRLLNGQMRVGAPSGAPNLLSGCPVLLTPGNRNRQTREGHADYTLRWVIVF